jgi:hypothetical protein
LNKWIPWSLAMASKYGYAQSMSYI